MKDSSAEEDTESRWRGPSTSARMMGGSGKGWWVMVDWHSLISAVRSDEKSVTCTARSEPV